MTSNDNQQLVTVEVYNSGINKLEKQVIQLGEQMNVSFRELKNEIQTVNNNVLINTARIEDQKDFMSSGFTIIAIVIALVAIMTTLAPMFRDMYRDAKKDKNREILRDIVREEVNLAVNRAMNVK